MKTNCEARVWCSENYESAQEAYYIYNAKKLILQEWRTSWKHALVSTILVVVATFLGWIQSPLLWIASMQIGFAFWGILSYCHNDQGAGGVAYLATLIFFITTLKEGHPVLKALYIIAGFVLLGASVIPEINYRKNLGSYATTPTERQWQSDEEEFEAWKRKYYTGYSRGANATSDESAGNNYDNSSTAQRADNQYATQAQTMFADFGTTYADLKKRYRKLAMKHHPDHGGEHDMFVAIVAEYEYLKSTRFPNEK